MCERWPGPRCNDKCKTRDVKKELLNQIAQVHTRESIEYKTALAELLSSQEIYDTTPRGIKELTETIQTQNIDSSIIPSRYLKGKSTRIMQTEALKEIDNERVSNIAEIVSTMYPVFSKEETETIIAASRENREKAVIKEMSVDVFRTQTFNIDGLNQMIDSNLETSGEEYYQYVDKIKTGIYDTYGNNPPKNVTEAIQKLDNMEPPNKVSLYAYRSIGNAIERSKTQLGEEINRISAIQDAQPKVVAEYFDAYRKDYNDNYSSAPSDKQPNPPKDWIEGDLPHNGITKNETTFFLPRDPATVYAIYKLRTDLNAIPDYLKQSTKLASVDETTEGYTVKYTSRTGKSLKTEKFSSKDELIKTLNNDTKDTTIIFKEEDEQTLSKLKDKHRIITLPDVASKHFDLQQKDPANLSHFFKTQSDTLDIYGAMRKRILKTWGTKPTRTQTANLDFKPDFNTRSSKFVR